MNGKQWKRLVGMKRSGGKLTVVRADLCTERARPRPRVNEYFLVRFVVVSLPLSLKEIVEVGLVPRGQISERLCQHIVAVSVP